MDMDEAVNADNKELLQVEETDDSCILDYIEVVPVDRDAVSGDWSPDVSQENLAVVKQEPDDVCCVILAYFCIFSLLQQRELMQILDISHIFRCQFSYVMIALAILLTCINNSVQSLAVKYMYNTHS